MEKGRTALITGITGQDGSYLTEFLISKGYRVRGIIRRSSELNTARIEHIIQKYEDPGNPDAPLWLEYGDMTDAASIRRVLEMFKPDEVYNLAAQSHVGISFNNPHATFDINAGGTLKMLDAIRDMKLPCKMYQASSSEMFGISSPPQSETTPMLPQSPYGISKLAAYNLTKMYRKAHGLFASNGILFNHESPRRGYNFVTRKITLELAKILTGDTEKIGLGNLDAKRDWGFSGEYVQAMWRILQLDEPGDYVIATEETHSVREFLEEAFGLVGLDYKAFLVVSEKHKRPAEVPALLGDSTKSKQILNWSPQVKFKKLVAMMVESDLKQALERKGLVPIVYGLDRPEGFYIERGKELAEAITRRKQFLNTDRYPSQYAQ